MSPRIWLSPPVLGLIMLMLAQGYGASVFYPLRWAHIPNLLSRTSDGFRCAMFFVFFLGSGTCGALLLALLLATLFP